MVIVSLVFSHEKQKNIVTDKATFKNRFLKKKIIWQHCEVMLIHTVMVVAGIGASSHFCAREGITLFAVTLALCFRGCRNR